MSIDAYDVKEYQDLANADIEFKYDANGNLISDLDRKIATIRYNLLNLPDTIQFENGNQIVNTYNASGRKLKTQYFTVKAPVVVPLGNTLQLTYERDSINESGTAYDGQFEYPYDKSKRLAGDPRHYRVHHAEGYVDRLEVHAPRAWTRNTYHYYRRDHLGNNCAVWDATNDTTLQKTVYYASGLPLSVSSGQSTQPYKYNGKEFIEMHGYDTYDYGFRGYYAAVGRFTTVDPLAEKYYGISPYVYCAGNPIMFIDPDGRQITGGIPSEQKKDGVWTTAQSTTYRPIPEKKEPVKMSESKKEQIRVEQSKKNQGTLKRAKSHYEEMADVTIPHQDRLIAGNPVVVTTVVATTAVVAAPVVAEVGLVVGTALETSVVAQAGAGVLDATIKIVLQENGVEVAPDWYSIETPFSQGASDFIMVLRDLKEKTKEDTENEK